MGAIPNELPGFQDVGKPEDRAKFEESWGVTVLPKYDWHLSQMIEAMDEVTSDALHGRREPGGIRRRPQDGDDQLEGLDHVVVQDILLTSTAQLADVVLRVRRGGRGSGTVTNSERRVQPCRKALVPPGDASDDV